VLPVLQLNYAWTGEACSLASDIQANMNQSDAWFLALLEGRQQQQQQ